MEKKFRAKILNLALPIAAQQFMLAVVSACDAFMLGGLNQNSLSAVSLASQITFVFNLILTALTIGENMFVAQYYGKKDFEGLRTSAGLVLRYVLLVSVFFLFATLFVPRNLMQLFTNDTTLIDYGIRYLKLIGFSYVFSGILQVLQGILKNCGYVGKCTMVSAIVVCSNIILNAIFIYGYLGTPRMEIAGAALATVIANGIGLVITICILYPKKELWIGIVDIGNKKVSMTKKFWKHVYPVLLNELVWGGGFTMYSVILGHLGSDAVAANSIANITKNMLICVCTGFGYGGSIILGNLLGEGNLSEARKSGNLLCKIAVVSGCLTGGMILLLTPVILHFASLTDTANGYLKYMLFMSSYYVIGKSINSMTIGGIFPAGGDTEFGLKCDAVTMWCFAVPLGFIAAFVLKLPVLLVYFVLNLDELVKLPSVYKHYRKYNWLKNLTEKGE
ncbi:MATE family efflux transporter [Blautia sp. HCP3S3_H10_1]|uniref:MATE family efflux transporter n=1 Tax=unclassified Blautia TaxID=2648079 RepID=UPI003F8F7BC4